jgi:hypothetical protein
MKMMHSLATTVALVTAALLASLPGTASSALDAESDSYVYPADREDLTDYGVTTQSGAYAPTPTVGSPYGNPGYSYGAPRDSYGNSWGSYGSGFGTDCKALRAALEHARKATETSQRASIGLGIAQVLVDAFTAQAHRRDNPRAREIIGGTLSEGLAGAGNGLRGRRQTELQQVNQLQAEYTANCAR